MTVKIILDCNGKRGIQHQEAGECLRKSGNPCWGWVPTHTYDLGGLYRITRVYARLNTGPSELDVEIPVAIEYSVDGSTWNTITTVNVLAKGDYVKEVNVDCNVDARYVRFRAENGYVDGSYAELEAEPLGGGFRFPYWVIVPAILFLVVIALLFRRGR